MRCRQPEKILFPPELAVFTAELHQFSAFLAGQWALAGTTELTAIDTGLTDPLGQAAHWNTEALGQVLYTHYVLPFQVAGLVLLVAMIGAIVLTLRSREGVKKQRISDQLARSRSDAVEVVKVNSGEGV